MRNLLMALGSFGIGLGVIVLFWLYFTFSYGWVFAQFWNWFIVPFGITTISTAQAIGITFTIGIILLQHRNEISEYKNHEKDNVLSKAIASVLSPWAIYFSGWVFHNYFIK